MTKLLGLYSPRPRMGKTTFAKELESKCPSAFILKFAEPGYEMATITAEQFLPGEAWDWLNDDRKDQPIPGIDVSMRQMLQEFLSAGRKLNPDMWVKHLQADIRHYKKWNYPLIVVDDVRMPNEYHMLRKEGATMIRLFRADAPATQEHESNEQLEGFEFDYDLSPTSVEDVQFKALAWLWKEGIK